MLHGHDPFTRLVAIGHSTLYASVLKHCRRCCGCLRQMRAAAPEQLTADRLLQLLQRGAHRLNSGHRQMSVEQLTGFLVGHFNLNSGTCCPVRGGHAHNIWKCFTHVAWCFCGGPSEDSELLHRVAMVHGAFDPAHTGTVSLQRVLLGMGQCFCPSVTMQVGTLLVGGGSLLHACAALPHQVAQAEVFFELFDMSGDGQLDNSEVRELNAVCPLYGASRDHESRARCVFVLALRSCTWYLNHGRR